MVLVELFTVNCLTILKTILRLNEITVKGDEVFNDAAGPRTRSTRASRPVQYSQVPLLAKLTKVLLMEVANLMELGEDDDDDEDEDSDGDSQDGSLNSSQG